MERRRRVVVVGAGVLGACLAVDARARGLDVMLVERARPGSGSTSRGAGVVRHGQWHPTNVRLVQRSLERMEAEDLEPWRVRRVGSVVLVPPALAGPARELAAMQEGLGVRVERLAPEDARFVSGMASARLEDVAEVLRYPDDAWALPRLYTEILTHVAQMGGLRVVRGEARLLPDGAGVRVGERTLEADAVVVAAGVWTRGILREAGLDAPLLAYRTQALRFHHEEAALVPIVHDLAQDCYLRPHWQGQLILGDGTTTTPEDPSAWAREADDTFLRSAVARLTRRFPHLDGGEITSAWAGLEAATPDRLPLAGPHPDAPRVWLCAGGNGHGFMRAPALAESLAAMLAEGEPVVDLSPFAPARFAGRMSEPFAIREGSRLEGPT